MPIINAITSPAPAIITTVDNSGNLVFQNAGTTNMTLDTNQNAIHTGYISAPNTFGFKNRTINGAMVINQRGFSSPPSNYDYLTDRFQYRASQGSKFTATQSTSIYPSGFTNSLGFTSSSAYTLVSSDQFGIRQFIEGYNIADLNWGTSSAQPVTLSFWVYTSLTGTHSGALGNNGDARAYPFTFTVNSASTWEYKTVTIAGDTSGTWLKTNGIGIKVNFNLGAYSNMLGTAGAWTNGEIVGATGSVQVVSTNGATFYITGVQLEKGSAATSFDYRPYGTELQLCQRYFQVAPVLYGAALSTTKLGVGYNYPVVMRSSPTAALLTSTPYAEWPDNTAFTASGATMNGTYAVGGAEFRVSGFSGMTAGRAPMWFQTNQISLSAEL